MPNHWDSKVIFIIGKLGVVLFFVLSGFLISYLLFKEKEVTKTISIKKFYMRRILRIWPLYFLIVLSAFFIFPFSGWFTIEGFSKDVVWNNLGFKLILYVIFLPNLVVNLFGIVPYASQTWSIGAEEQFYLAWPVLNKYFKNRWALMFGVIFIYLAVKFPLYIFPLNKYLNIFKAFWNTTPIDCMAIGGLFALLIYENNSAVVFVRKILFSKVIQAITFLAIIICIYKGFLLPYVHYEFYSVLFGIMICNFAYNEQRLFSMENVLTNYLGKISYGLYMYHPIAIVFSLKISQQLNMALDYIIYPLAFISVIALSVLSYEFYEKKFINKKIKYSEIVSGDNARQ